MSDKFVINSGKRLRSGLSLDPKFQPMGTVCENYLHCSFSHGSRASKIKLLATETFDIWRFSQF